ncbi:hypothetical protein PC117_g14306 [Phytophthora cactorum]|uniref:Uncharacterized protein n=1 Tax=Phytophthora cactorum TaxID=29920 RepID=A0A8T1CUE6_9STRA|nr:hypothetical protein PC117_g14306 [Phytophthora cactorum]
MSDSEPEVHVPSAGLWESSPIAKEWHENWEAFKDYLERYQEDTHQLFRLRSPTSVARRNAEIKDHAGGSSSETSDSGSMRIPQELKTFWVKYISTHGWQHKAYFGNSTECKADIKAAVTWNKEERKFMVRVTGSSTSHNHRVDRAVYENHPSVRRVENPVLLAFVDVMQSSGSKPKRIMEFLRERQSQRDISLEASWGHIKEILKPEMPLDECVDELIFLQAVAEMDYSKKMTAVGYMRYQGADAELEQLLREVSTHAYRQIEQQYWIAKDRTTHYKMNAVTSDMYTVVMETLTMLILRCVLCIDIYCVVSDY